MAKQDSGESFLEGWNDSIEHDQLEERGLLGRPLILRRCIDP